MRSATRSLSKTCCWDSTHDMLTAMSQLAAWVLLAWLDQVTRTASVIQMTASDDGNKSEDVNKLRRLVRFSRAPGSLFYQEMLEAW